MPTQSTMECGTTSKLPLNNSSSYQPLRWKPSRRYMIPGWVQPTLPPGSKNGVPKLDALEWMKSLRSLSATLQISLPRFISQERIFRGFLWPTKVTRRDREGVSRMICYINIISAMLGFRVRVDDSSPRLTLAIVFHHKCRRAHQKALLTLNMKT